MHSVIHKISISGIGRETIFVHKNAKVLDIDYQVINNQVNLFLWVAHDLENELVQLPIEIIATGGKFNVSLLPYFFKTIHIRELHQVWHVFIKKEI